MHTRNLSKLDKKCTYKTFI